MNSHRLHVEVVSSTFDFQGWYHNLGLSVKGLASTAGCHFTNHSWEFVPRKQIESRYGDSVQITCNQSDWETENVEPMDVILICRQYIHSTTLSQEPVVFLPTGIVKKLDGSKLKVAATNLLNERTLSEFRKTATAVARSPWELLKAQRWLDNLCEQNTLTNFGEPIALKFIFELDNFEN